jgi:hypothetical protein
MPVSRLPASRLRVSRLRVSRLRVRLPSGFPFRRVAQA